MDREIERGVCVYVCAHVCTHAFWLCPLRGLAAMSACCPDLFCISFPNRRNQNFLGEMTDLSKKELKNDGACQPEGTPNDLFIGNRTTK